MEIGRLMYLLDIWQEWMKKDNTKLGYPKKSLGMISGGYSNSENFDEMLESAELEDIRLVDTCIDELEPTQRAAIYHRYLGDQAPKYYPIKLELAIDNLLTIVGRRINLL